MKEFSFSDLSRRSGDVLDTAVREPVSLVKRGKPRIVMMPIEEYERLRQGEGSSRMVQTIYDAPDEDIEALMAGMEEIISEAERSE